MRTSISKKLLAGALSVMMVLSLVAPTGAQAASKYSLTDKKTVKADTTYKYQLKGVKKTQYVKIVRNVSGETVKYNKKAVVKSTKIKGTGKTLNLFVKYSEKNKNYTGKFTVKIFNKKTNKVAKKIVETVTVKTQKKQDTKVAVTGVSLDNTTPKVGDVITATVAPANATNVTYQWLADNAVIAGATAATYTVAETDLGKALSVSVTGDNGSSAKSAETAKVEAKAAAEIAVTAKQTHGKVVEVTYTTGTPSDDNTYKVTKGAQNVAIAAKTVKDNVVTLTMSANLTDGEFKVEVATTAGKKAEATFTGAKPVLTEVKFTNNNLAVSANTTEGMKKGYAHIESVDQFGDHMNLTSPTFTVSKGDASFKSDTGILTLDATNTSDHTYKLGEMVVVSVMYDNNTKVVPATLTVTTAAMAKTITFGEIQSDDAKAYPTDKITQGNLTRGVYWFPVTEAKDDSGIELDAERLNKMVEAQTVFITPKDQTGTIIYADQFSEKTVNGKKVIALVVKGGSELAGLNAGVDMQISVFSVGGAQATLPVKIVRDAVIKELNIDIPELYVGKTSEIKLSATDTDGNPVDLYKVTSNKSLGTPDDDKDHATPTDAVKSAALRFWDTAKGTDAIGTKITMSTGMNCEWALVRNATNHSVSLKVTPAAGSDEGYLNITGTTAAFTAVTKANIKINKTRTIDGVTGFAASLPTKYLTSNAGAPGVISGNRTVLSLSDGSAVGAGTANYKVAYVQDGGKVLANASSAVAALQLKNKADGNEGQEITSVDGDVYLYTMEITGKGITTNNTDYVGNAFTLTSTPATTSAVLTNGAGGSAALVVNPSAKTGQSDTVKITLYKLSKINPALSGGEDIKVEQIGTKSVTFSVEDEKTANYKIIFDPDDDVMYAGLNNDWNSDVLPIYITTANGAAVSQDKLESVKVVNKNNDGATFDFIPGEGIVCTHKSDKPAGQKMKATINATIASNGDTVDVSAEFVYVTDQPQVTYTGLYADPFFSVPVTGNKLTATDATIGEDAGQYIMYWDQYVTEASADGISVDAKVMNVKASDGTAKEFDGTAEYEDGVVTIYAGSSFTGFAAGDTFQVVINGGQGLTLYCTAGGAITLSAVPDRRTPITTSVTKISAINSKDLSGSTISFGTAKAAGKVYLSKDAEFDQAEDILLGSFNEGATNISLTEETAVSGLEGNTDYYTLIVPTDDTEYRTVASETATKSAAARFASANFERDSADFVWKSNNVTDQYGKAFLLTAVTNPVTVTPNTDDAVTATMAVEGGAGNAQITFVKPDADSKHIASGAKDAVAFGDQVKIAVTFSDVAALDSMALTSAGITNVAVTAPTN